MEEDKNKKDNFLYPRPKNREGIYIYSKEEWKEILDYYIKWQIKEFGRLYEKGTDLGKRVWKTFKRLFDI